jgi:hypothetical protein
MSAATAEPEANAAQANDAKKIFFMTDPPKRTAEFQP